MCLRCFISKNDQNGCIQCERVPKEDLDFTNTTSKDDDFDDFDQNQLFDEWNESESFSPNEQEQNDGELLRSVYDDETEEADSDDDDENPIDPPPQAYKVQWLSDIKDDAAEFSSDHTYQHTESMLEVFDDTFGLKQVSLSFAYQPVRNNPF